MKTCLIAKMCVKSMYLQPSLYYKPCSTGKTDANKAIKFLLTKNELISNQNRLLDVYIHSILYTERNKKVLQKSSLSANCSMPKS